MPDTKTRLLAAVKNGDTTVTFGKVRVGVVPTGDFWRVEVPGDQPEGFKWDEATELAYWEGALIDDAVAKVDAALKGKPVKGASKEIKVTIEAEGMSLTDLIGITKPVEVTENYIRIRARDPADFQEGTFRTVDLSEEKGIKTVMGRLKGEKTMTIQTYLFDKGKWTKEQAQKWIKGQSKKKEGDSKTPGKVEERDKSVVLLATDGEAVLGEFVYDEYDTKDEAVAAAQAMKKRLVAELAGAVKEEHYFQVEPVVSLPEQLTKTAVEGEKALLPIAEKGRGWDAGAAVGRVRKWASTDGSGDKDKINWSKYARAFFYRDADMADGFGGYKLPFADVVDGTLRAIPEGIYAAAQAVQGARTPMKVPLEGPKKQIAAYYSKMGEEAPWKREKEASYLPVVEEKEPTMRMAVAVAKAMLKRQKSATTVWREGDDRYYMALISMAVFDEEDQIVEKEGMDCSIALAQKYGYRSGLYIRHVVPLSLVGRSMYERRLGPYWVEVGKFGNTPLADWGFRILENDKEGKWKLSIGFITTREQAKKGRYTRLLKYDTTITDRPALPVTAVLAVGGKTEMNDIAKLLTFLNPQSEEEKEKATAMLGDLFDLEERELAAVVKEAEQAEALRKALDEAGIEDDVKDKIVAALEPEPEPEPPQQQEVDLSQQVQDAVVAAMAGVEERLAVLEQRPGAAEAVKEIGDLLKKRSQALPKPSETAPVVEGVSDLVDKIDKHIGEVPGPKHPLAGFAGGPSQSEGG